MTTPPFNPKSVDLTATGLDLWSDHPPCSDPEYRAAIELALRQGAHYEWRDRRGGYGGQWHSHFPLAKGDVVHWCSHDYRLYREPISRPWSKPSDVPGPVCWVRGKAWDGYLFLVTVILTRGIYAGSMDLSWGMLTSIGVEYSTDTVTWQPCTTTAP